MKPRHQVSRTAIEMIKRFEGYRRKAAQLPDGRWTIGYGHTRTARQGAEVSEADAEALLIYDLMAVTQAVSDLTFTALTQNQFDALCAFAFNIGLDNFRASRVLKHVNEGALIQAACGMELWRKAEFEGEVIVVDGLVRRRAAEKTLFLTPANGAWVAVPTPLLQPDFDAEGLAGVHDAPPTPVVASLEGEQIRVLREDEPAPPPVPPQEEASPVTMAAETITARLATVFKDESPEADVTPAADAELSPAEPVPEPDLSAPAEPEAAAKPAPEAAPFVEAASEELPEEVRPQADFAPPITVEAGEDTSTAIETEPFVLEAEAAGQPAEPQAETETFEPEVNAAEAAGPDLFEQPEPANDARAEAEPQDDADLLLDDNDRPPLRDRRVIDDLAPYDFVASPVQSLQKPKDGYLALISLAVLGIAFFAGGFFWAINAQVTGGPVWLGPKVVGGLASVAGVGFFAIALFLLLERLAWHAERDEGGQRKSHRRGGNPRI